jgi:hypothetical protein
MASDKTVAAADDGASAMIDPSPFLASQPAERADNRLGFAGAGWADECLELLSAGRDSTECGCLVSAETSSVDRGLGEGGAGRVAGQIQQDCFDTEDDGRGVDLAIVDREHAVAADTRDGDGREVGRGEADRVLLGAFDDRLQCCKPVVGGDETEQPALACGLGEKIPARPGRTLGLQCQHGRGAIRVERFRAQICRRQRTLAGCVEGSLDRGDGVLSDGLVGAFAPVRHEYGEGLGVVLGRPVHEGCLLP